MAPFKPHSRAVNKAPPRRSFTLICTTAALAALTLSSCAKPGFTGDTRVLNPRTTATPPNATIAAAYMDILSVEGDRVLGASTPVAESVEIHESRHEDGTARMRRLEEIAVPAGQRITFATGGMHFMLIGLTQPLVAGEDVPFTLHFDKAGNMSVELTVSAPGDDGMHQH